MKIDCEPGFEHSYRNIGEDGSNWSTSIFGFKVISCFACSKNGTVLTRRAWGESDINCLRQKKKWVREAVVQVRRMIVGATGVSRAGSCRETIRVRWVWKAGGLNLHAEFEEAMYVRKAGIEL